MLQRHVASRLTWPDATGALPKYWYIALHENPGNDSPVNKALQERKKRKETDEFDRGCVSLVVCTMDVR